MAFSSVFVVTNSLRLRRFRAVSVQPSRGPVTHARPDGHPRTGRHHRRLKRIRHHTHPGGSASTPLHIEGNDHEQHRQDRGDRGLRRALGLLQGRHRGGAVPPPGGAGGGREPGVADRDRQLRPGPDVGDGTGRVGAGLRVPLRRAVRPRPRVRPDGRTHRSLPRRPPRAGRYPAARGSAPRPRRRQPRRRARSWARRRRAADRPGRDGTRRAPRRDVDGRHGRRHAEPVRGRRGAVGAGAAVVTDRPGGVRVHRPGAVRAARRRVLAAAVAAGDLLLGVDLLRRRLPGAEGPDAGHDGAGRRRGRRGLAVQRRGHPDRLSPAAATCSTRPPRC